MLARAQQALSSGWRLSHSGVTCDATRWPNLIFYCLCGFATMFSFIWCGTWRRMVVWLSTMIVSFFFFSLSYQVKGTIALFFFSISVLILLIFYYVFFSFIEVFFNLVIQLQFLICFVFHFGLYFFFIVFLDSFVKGFFDFQFHHSIKVFVVLLFSLWPLFFWFFFLLVKAIFQFNLTLQLKIFICPLIHFFFFIFTLIILDPFMGLIFFLILFFDIWFVGDSVSYYLIVLH